MTLDPSQVVDYVRRHRVAELGTDKVEVRLMAIVISMLFFYQLVEPGTYILFIENSMTRKVASLTMSPLAVGLLFYATALLLVPHLVALFFLPKYLRCKTPRRLSCAAAVLGGLLWALLATMARPLDDAWLSVVFLIRAAVDLALGLLWGVSLNAQRAKEAEDAERSKNHERYAETSPN